MAGKQRPTGHTGLLVKTWPKLSETFILEEVLGLERAGVPLQIYALQPPTDAIAHDALNAVRAPVCYLPTVTLRHLPTLAAAQLRSALRQPLRHVGGLVRASLRGQLKPFMRGTWLAEHMRRRQIAHVHTHFISAPADVAEHVAALGLGFSISAHAKDIYTSRPEDLKRKLEAARFTVTCTEYNRRHLAGLAPEAPIERMYHGVDAGRFSPDLRTPTETPALILAVGRLKEKKGFDTLIDACQHLHAAGRRFRCEIVGYGDGESGLRQHIARAGLGAHIHLTGKLARTEVIDRYARASVFVQPSRIGHDGDRDGIPNVLLEAMAMGVPVISTPVSGIPEVVETERTGLLVPPDQPALLADAILRLLDNAPLATRLAAYGRQRVLERFDNDHNLALLRSSLETAHVCQRHSAQAAPRARNITPAA